MSEITQRPQLFSLSGMTAQAASASTAATSGASRNTPLSAPAGIKGSLSTNFKRSANDCSRPNGPTTFGPRRSCTAAQTLRSIKSRKAMVMSKSTSSTRLSSTISSSGHRKACQMSDQSQALAMRPRRVFVPVLLQGAELSHDARGPCDRVRQIEVGDGADEGIGADRAPACRQGADAGVVASVERIQAHQLRRRLEHGRAQGLRLIVGERVADVTRQGANDRP